MFAGSTADLEPLDAGATHPKENGIPGAGSSAPVARGNFFNEAESYEPTGDRHGLTLPRSCGVSDFGKHRRASGP
jgi:hypothetical protein